MSDAVAFSLVRTIGAGVAGLVLLLPGVSHTADLRDFVSQLYGGDGVQLAPQRTSKDFESTSSRGLETLGSEIASSLNLVSSGGGGSSFVFDFELGVLVQTSEGFGPLVAERADTIGARRLSIGFSYTRIDFKRFNDVSLSELSRTFPSIDLNEDGQLGPPPGSTDIGLVIELDELLINLKLDIEQEAFALLGKYGITDSWDTELIVPILRVHARARGEARVSCNEIDESFCTAFHFFDPAAGGDAPNSSSGGTKTGIGDVVLRSKYHFLRDSDLWPDVAVRGQVKLPTGDEKDLLGTGNADFQLMLIASKTWWLFTPHLNLAYELSTGPAALDNLDYAAGVEANLDKRLTLVLDLVGRFAPHANTRSDHIIDIALGGRVNVWQTLLLNANVLVPLNRSRGLRPNFIWTVGFQYAFGGS